MLCAASEGCVPYSRAKALPDDISSLQKCQALVYAGHALAPCLLLFVHTVVYQGVANVVMQGKVYTAELPIGCTRRSACSGPLTAAVCYAPPCMCCSHALLCIAYCEDYPAQHALPRSMIQNKGDPNKVVLACVLSLCCSQAAMHELGSELCDPQPACERSVCKRTTNGVQAMPGSWHAGGQYHELTLPEPLLTSP